MPGWISVSILKMKVMWQPQIFFKLNNCWQRNTIWKTGYWAQSLPLVVNWCLARKLPKRKGKEHVRLGPHLYLTQRRTVVAKASWALSHPLPNILDPQPLILLTSHGISNPTAALIESAFSVLCWIHLGPASSTYKHSP